jgi:patatin-like phospholipase/acyl hydrolase
MSERLQQCISADGPKKILACDGGGILGLMSVEILAELELRLRERHANPSLVLSDYFDFVCGTSTGAIIASCIATGMSMEQIRRFYLDSGAQMFDRAFLLKRLKYSYNDEPLAAKLRSALNEALGYRESDPPATLGDGNLRNLLMMVLRNHTTDSPWPVSNNPNAAFNRPSLPDCNLRLPLWQLVRASTAAPTFFPPEVVTFAEGTDHEYDFIFVDGGVTTYNNPAFLAFQMATASPYKLNWKCGVDDLLIVSIGTGNAPAARPDLDVDEMGLIHHAKSIPGALMNAASAGWDTACRMLGYCTFGDPIDEEVGAMLSSGDTANWSGQKAFTYLRYNPDVTRAGLDALGLKEIEPQQVQLMDSIAHIDQIRTVGRSYAEHNVDLSHLRGFT